MTHHFQENVGSLRVADCGACNPILRCANEWGMVDCEECQAHKPDTEELKPDVIVKVKP